MFTIELFCAASSTLGHIPELIFYVDFVVLQEMKRVERLFDLQDNRGAKLCVKSSLGAQIQMEQSKES
jgi:hypothetical protein